MNCLRMRWAVTALAIAVLGSLGSASLAGAATANDTTQFAVTAGALSFGTAPDVPNFAGVTLNGQSQTTNATMTSFSTVDATGSGLGWNVTVQGDTSASKSPIFKQYCPIATCGTDSGPGYIGGGATLAANSLTLNSTGSGFTAQNGTTGTAPTQQCAVGCNVDAAAPSKVISAASGAGMGTYQANAYTATSLGLTVPTTVKTLQASEVYHLDLVWSLNSGP
jgi:WxL domain surface cell wall-binding